VVTRAFSELLPRRSGHRQRRARAAAALLAAVIPLLTATASPAAADATTPTEPPPVTVLTQGADNRNGDIFIAPTSATGTYANGPEIISNTGKVIWFHALPPGYLAADFRTQTYQGRPVLTWFQTSAAPGSGADYIYDDHYRQIAVVKAGNGYTTDGHEFLITPWNTALILADTYATVDLTSIGGPANQTVLENAVQEIDIRTGRVLFQWNSADYVPWTDTGRPLPPTPAAPWDWFHANAVHLDTDGNLLISSRYTWTVYKVNRRTGKIMWELGGAQSTFTLAAAPGQTLDNAGSIFAWQHDPEVVGHNTYTVFDDESVGPISMLPYSRVVTVKLDFKTKTATLVKSIAHPDGLLAASQGNAQTTRNGDLFVGWGNLPYISEFSPSGKLLFNAQFPAGVNTYRAYRLPWHPRG
jgi:hypothetical protein